MKTEIEKTRDRAQVRVWEIFRRIKNGIQEVFR